MFKTVLPAKIFELRNWIDQDLMIKNLKIFREEEPYETNYGEKINLLTEILDLKQEESYKTGVFCKDFLIKNFYKREMIEAPITEEAPFCITHYNDRAYLIISAPSGSGGGKKLLTNHIANKLSEVLYNKVGNIVEIKISSDNLKNLHESNPEATKLIWFDDIDIPSVEKLCLAGSNIADTRLYNEYLEHGKIWYVVFEVQKRGLVIGITRNCVVTLFSKSTFKDFLTYITEDLLSLIEE